MRLKAVLQPVIAVASAAALTGCLFSETVESFGGPTMGSTYSVKFVQSASAPNAEALQADVQAILASVDKQMSTYRSDSDLETFNHAAAGCYAMPAPILQLVEYGTELARKTDGAFDVTLEPLITLWGFGAKSRGQQVPDDAALARVREQYGYQHLQVRDGQLCKDRDAIQVDLNSMAAGYAVDHIAAMLESKGVSSYLVEVTGELKAVGRKPDGAPWRIAIEAPQSDVRAVQQIVELDGLSVSTSGDYRNYFEQDGRRFSHTLDPRQAAPINHTLASVTVVTPSAMEADGLSTLLMVLGPEEGLRFAEAEHIPALFVSRVDEGFVSRGSSAFNALFTAPGVKP